MYDLAAPGVPAVSLRDTAAAVALQRLVRCDVDTPEDLTEVCRPAARPGVPPLVQGLVQLEA